ncbi:hypothetical protein Tco_0421565 [Tanacetum coccineum]
MASHRLNSLYAIKECSTCGSLYTRECCSIRSFEDKILVPKPDSSTCCAKCGKPVDGPYCRGCAFLRNKFEEDLLTYYGENETSKDFEDIFESSDDNTNVVNAPREPFVVNQDPGVKSSQDPPQIDHNYGDKPEEIALEMEPLRIILTCDEWFYFSLISILHHLRIRKPTYP